MPKNRIIKKCIVCGKEKSVKKSHEKVEGTYCSKGCMTTDYATRMLGINNPNYKNINKIVKCKVCFSDFDAGYNYKKRVVCSRKCNAIMLSTNMKGISPSKEVIDKRWIGRRKKQAFIGKKKYFCSCGSEKKKPSKNCIHCSNKKRREEKQKEKECSICGNLFYNKHKKFCSAECATKSRRLRVGKNNGNWKGGITSENSKERRTDEYKEWRIAVFERDKYTCQDCGQIGGKLHAHHKKSFSKNKELRTDLSNGETLCIPCHGKHHPNLIKLNERNGQRKIRT